MLTYHISRLLRMRFILLDNILSKLIAVEQHVSDSCADRHALGLLINKLLLMAH